MKSLGNTKISLRNTKISLWNKNKNLKLQSKGSRTVNADEQTLNLFYLLGHDPYDIISRTQMNKLKHPS